MNDSVVFVCPDCGFALDDTNRKGDLIFCPACKKYYKITHHSGRKLGACPYGCGETITDKDLKEDGTLDCPKCKKKSFQRLSDGNPILLQYKGTCPDCGKKIGHSDCQNDGYTYVCPDCGDMLCSRDNYTVKVIKDYCPICHNPLCSYDVLVPDKVTGRKVTLRCDKCGNMFPFEPQTLKIPKTLLFAIPKTTWKDFKFKSFKKMMQVSPANVASKMHIISEKVNYKPLSEEHQIPDPEKSHIFTSDIADVQRALGGNADVVPDAVLKNESTAIALEPEYTLEYTYKDSTKRSFITNDFSEEITETNIPKENYLIEKKYGTIFFVIYFNLVLICAIIWWFKSISGFFDGLFSLIEIGLLVLVAFWIGIASEEAINHLVANRIAKRKIKEFKELHNLEYTIQDSNIRKDG